MRKKSTDSGLIRAPEIKLEPIIKVEVPATDMKPIAEAIKSLKPKSEGIKLSNKNRTLEIEVTERDRTGAIKKLVCTEVLI